MSALKELSQSDINAHYSSGMRPQNVVKNPKRNKRRSMPESLRSKKLDRQNQHLIALQAKFDNCETENAKLRDILDLLKARIINIDESPGEQCNCSSTNLILEMKEILGIREANDDINDSPDTRGKDAVIDPQSYLTRDEKHNEMLTKGTYISTSNASTSCPSSLPSSSYEPLSHLERVTTNHTKKKDIRRKHSDGQLGAERGATVCSIEKVEPMKSIEESEVQRCIMRKMDQGKISSWLSTGTKLPSVSHKQHPRKKGGNTDAQCIENHDLLTRSGGSQQVNTPPVQLPKTPIKTEVPMSPLSVKLSQKKTSFSNATQKRSRNTQSMTRRPKRRKTKHRWSDFDYVDIAKGGCSSDKEFSEKTQQTVENNLSSSRSLPTDTFVEHVLITSKLTDEENKLKQCNNILNEESNELVHKPFVQDPEQRKTRTLSAENLSLCPITLSLSPNQNETNYLPSNSCEQHDEKYDGTTSKTVRRSRRSRSLAPPVFTNPQLGSLPLSLHESKTQVNHVSGKLILRESKTDRRTNDQRSASKGAKSNVDNLVEHENISSATSAPEDNMAMRECNVVEKRNVTPNGTLIQTCGDNAFENDTEQFRYPAGALLPQINNQGISSDGTHGATLSPNELIIKVEEGLMNSVRRSRRISLAVPNTTTSLLLMQSPEKTEPSNMNKNKTSKTKDSSVTPLRRSRRKSVAVCGTRHSQLLQHSSPSPVFSSASFEQTVTSLSKNQSKESNKCNTLVEKGSIEDTKLIERDSKKISLSQDETSAAPSTEIELGEGESISQSTEGRGTEKICQTDEIVLESVSNNALPETLPEPVGFVMNSSPNQIHSLPKSDEFEHMRNSMPIWKSEKRSSVVQDVAKANSSPLVLPKNLQEQMNEDFENKEIFLFNEVKCNITKSAKEAANLENTSTLAQDVIPEKHRRAEENNAEAKKKPNAAERTEIEHVHGTDVDSTFTKDTETKIEVTPLMSKPFSVDHPQSSISSMTSIKEEKINAVQSKSKKDGRVSSKKHVKTLRRSRRRRSFGIDNMTGASLLTTSCENTPVHSSCLELIPFNNQNCAVKMENESSMNCSPLASSCNQESHCTKPLSDEKSMKSKSALSRESLTAQGKQKHRRRRSSTRGCIAGGGVLTAADVQALAAESQLRMKKQKGGRTGSRKENQNSTSGFLAGDLTDNINESGLVPNETLSIEKYCSSEEKTFPYPTQEDPASADASAQYNVGNVHAQKKEDEYDGVNSMIQDKSTSSTPRIKSILRKKGDKSKAVDSIAKNEGTFHNSQSLVQAIAPKVSILRRCEKLFNREISTSLPCPSEIFVTCVSLMVDRTSMEKLRTPHNGLVDLHRPKHEKNWMEPLLPILKAFVQFEMTVINHRNGYGMKEQSLKNDHNSKVTFCSSTSVTPPVDTHIGSHWHLNCCIEKLQVIVKEIDSFCYVFEGFKSKRTKNETHQEKLKQVRLMISAMRALENPANAALREACAKAICYERDQVCWSTSRLFDEIRRYRVEFEEINDFLSTEHREKIAFSSSPIRKYLGELLGAAVRFHLRRLFNPVPVCYTKPSEKHPTPDWEGCRSRIHQLVCMTAPDGVASGDSATADGSVSSVLNLALQYIYANFDFAGNRIDRVKLCTSKTSQMALDAGLKHSKTLPEHDLMEILDDINGIHGILGTGRACRFVSELLEWPGVLDAIEDAGGWGVVEDLGNVFTKHNLENICLDEAHFVLLKDATHLICSLSAGRESINETITACEERLGDIWKLFKCGTKSKSILRRNPNIRIIREALLEQVTFPNFCSPDEGY